MRAYAACVRVFTLAVAGGSEKRKRNPELMNFDVPAKRLLPVITSAVQMSRKVVPRSREGSCILFVCFPSVPLMPAVAIRSLFVRMTSREPMADVLSDTTAFGHEQDLMVNG